MNLSSRRWCWFWISWCLLWLAYNAWYGYWLPLAIHAVLGAVWTTKLSRAKSQ